MPEALWIRGATATIDLDDPPLWKSRTDASATEPGVTVGAAARAAVPPTLSSAAAAPVLVASVIAPTGANRSRVWAPNGAPNAPPVLGCPAPIDGSEGDRLASKLEVTWDALGLGAKAEESGDPASIASVGVSDGATSEAKSADWPAGATTGPGVGANVAIAVADATEPGTTAVPAVDSG